MDRRESFEQSIDITPKPINIIEGNVKPVEITNPTIDATETHISAADINDSQISEREVTLDMTAEEYSTYLFEWIKKLVDRPQNTEDLRDYEPLKNLRERLKNSADPKERELSDVLEAKIMNIDNITGLYRREIQNDIIQRHVYNRIAESKNLTEALEKLNKLALIAIDLRSLKAVNDATHDHVYGDYYLRRVANFLRHDLKPELKEIFDFEPDSEKISVSRDGGDEFSFFLINNQIDWRQKISDLEPDKKEKIIKVMTENSLIEEQTTEEDLKEIKLLNVITKLITKKLGEQNHNIIFLSIEEQVEYEQLEDKMKKSQKIESQIKDLVEQINQSNSPTLDAQYRKQIKKLKQEKTVSELNSKEEKRMIELEMIARQAMCDTFEDYTNEFAEENERVQVPLNFDLRSYAAVGGTTGGEIIGKEAEDGDFKKFNEIKHGVIALTKIMGALRTRSDRRYYTDKEQQDRELESSNDEEKLFRAILKDRKNKKLIARLREIQSKNK